MPAELNTPASTPLSLTSRSYHHTHITSHITHHSRTHITLAHAQLIDHGGFYDRPLLYWKNILDVSLVAACGPPDGGRNPVTPRFMRHFAMLHIEQTSTDTLKVRGVGKQGRVIRWCCYGHCWIVRDGKPTGMRHVGARFIQRIHALSRRSQWQHIYTHIVRGFLEDFPQEIKLLTRKVVAASVEIYQRVSSELLPKPSKSHYTFNIRDLSAVIQVRLIGRLIACY